MRVTAIVPAAGSGSRMGGAEPKQYLRLAGVPLLSRTLLALTASGCVDHLVLVVPAGQEPRCRAEILVPYGIAAERVVPGGADRQASVGAGLAAAPADSDLILVHDGARPFVTGALIRQALAAAAEAGGAVVAVPVTDTIKRADETGTIRETPARAGLWAAQTPQAFQARLFREAHQRAQADGFRSTDDSALVERLGCPIRLVPGSRDNLKVTTVLDLILAEALLRAAAGGG
jgi:2-C-methyl-D-erythritol 4-phosphate cytidylyltransferase